MRRFMTKMPRPRVAALATGAAVVGATAALLLLNSGSSTSRQGALAQAETAAIGPVTLLPVPLTGTILVLAPPDKALPSGTDSPGGAVVRRLTTQSELAAALNDSVQAVVVDRLSVDQADSEWFAARLAEGRIIAGLDLHMRDLQRLVGDRSGEDFGHMTIETGFVSALVGGEGSKCSSGVYSQTSLLIALEASTQCMNPRFGG